VKEREPFRRAFTSLPELVERADRILGRAAARRYWPICVALTLAAASCNGLGRVPGDDHRLYAIRLFSPTASAGPAERFYPDIALPLLARGLGATSPRAFFLLCLAIVLAALAMLAWRLRATLEPELAAIVFALVLAHPAVTILLSWIGEPDAITFAVTAVTLLWSSPAAIGAAAAVGVANHTMAIASLSLVLVVRWAGGERIAARHAVALLAGLLVGWVLVRQFLAAQHLVAGSRLEFVTDIGFGYWIRQSLGSLPILLWSLHGGVWLALIACAWPLWQTNRAYVLTQAAALTVALLAALVSLDTTRVFALIAWAPAIHLVLTAWRREPDGPERATLRGVLIVVALVALTAPRLFVWEGAVVASPFRNIPVRIYHGVAATFDAR
jgi:hypothetical protein